VAVRTTELQVIGVLGANYDGTTSLTPFIDTATSLVDDIDMADTSSLMSDNRLELIERYLAAHFYAHADMIAASRSTGAAGGSFQGQTSLGFDGTYYGQTAKRLDATGLLMKLDMPVRPKASLKWMGKIKDDQLDADERTTD
jgi:hypothetical protein